MENNEKCVSIDLLRIGNINNCYVNNETNNEVRYYE